MSIKTNYVVICDKCDAEAEDMYQAKTGTGSFYEPHPGWVFTGSKDYCPDCTTDPEVNDVEV